MRLTSFVAGSMILALICLQGVSIAAGSPPFTPGRNVTVMTYNVYLGADVSPLLGASTESELQMAVAAIWAQVQASNIPLRASRIAGNIKSLEPDLVGLQEVAQWSTGPSPDSTKVQYDFLQLILADLADDGAHYVPVVVHDNLDATAPTLVGNTPLFVRFVDRDVLLARSDLPAADLKLSDLQAHSFSTLLTFMSPLFGEFTVPRGWISADVKVRGKTFRFITTHLETFNSSVNVAQGQELLDGPAKTSMPVVMAGDFNSSANGGFDVTDTYPNIIDTGFQDAWAEINPNLAGDTCCQAADLSNSSSDLFERIDLIFTNGGVGASSAQLVGDQPIDSGVPYWASDHAGVVATLKLPTTTTLRR